MPVGHSSGSSKGPIYNHTAAFLQADDIVVVRFARDEFSPMESDINIGDPDEMVALAEALLGAAVQINRRRRSRAEMDAQDRLRKAELTPGAMEALGLADSGDE